MSHSAARPRSASAPSGAHPPDLRASLDAADLRLLDQLQQDSSRSVAELAEAAGLTAQTCHRRLQRLRRSGVILREAAVLDPACSSAPLQVMVELFLANWSPEGFADLERSIRARREIMQCFVTTGDRTHVLILRLEKPSDYEQFVREFCLQEPMIRDFRSHFVLRQLKDETALPLFRLDETRA